MVKAVKTDLNGVLGFGPSRVRLLVKPMTSSDVIEIKHQKRASSRMRVTKSRALSGCAGIAISKCSQGGNVDGFAPHIHASKMCHRFAAAHDANRLAGSGLGDEFAQVSFRLCEIDLLDDRLLTKI